MIQNIGTILKHCCRGLANQIGLDASTFLRFLRMVRSIFTVTCVISVALIVINIIYNMKNVPKEARTALSLLTIANVSGSWAWPALASSYLISKSSC
jgi:phage shock protein PspC (stress-responsive transcriptional regulator)